MKNYSKRTPEGTRDLLFEECSARRTIEHTLSDLFKARGYNKVITPTLEFFDLFHRESAGMPSETLYNLTDAYGRLIVLRPDSTLPIARIVATRLKGAQLPIRLYYNQSVFRRRPRFAGHNDETVQGGIELIGASGIRADLEIITTAVDALNRCGAPDYRIEIGHAGFFKALCNSLNTDSDTIGDIAELIEAKNYSALNDLLDKIGNTEITRAIRMLPRLFGGEEVIDKAVKLISQPQAIEALDYLRSVYHRLEQLGLNGKINIDLGLAHRSNYYTGIVIRGYIEGSGITVLSGGRYDMLIGEFGESLPAIGFGVETDALADAMLARGDVEPTKVADVLVFGEDGQEVNALIYARELNANGLVCENSIANSLEEALDYAIQKEIPRLDAVTKDGIEIKLVKEMSE